MRVQSIDLLLQRHHVQVGILIAQPLLDRLRHVGGIEHPLVGRAWRIVGLDHSAAVALFGASLVTGRKKFTYSR